MKPLLVMLLLGFSSISAADNLTISPGSTIAVGVHTVTCSPLDQKSRCLEVFSSDPKINTCSNQIRGTRCTVGDFRGVCDLANEGFENMCKCL